MLAGWKTCTVADPAEINTLRRVEMLQLVQLKISPNWPGLALCINTLQMVRCIPFIDLIMWIPSSPCGRLHEMVDAPTKKVFFNQYGVCLGSNIPFLINSGSVKVLNSVNLFELLSVFVTTVLGSKNSVKLSCFGSY